jgi:cytochrome c
MTWPTNSTRWAATGVWAALLVGSPLAAQAQSAVRGQALFESRCTACHSLDTHRVGPALQAVVGRKAGTAKDYDYSPALAAASHRWSRPTLLAWLTNPETVVPGQRMGYRVDAAADREDLVAFLTANGKRPGSK